MLWDKEFADFTIVCQGKIFDCHRNILALRSKVFRAMLTTDDGREKTSGTLNIVDFEDTSVRQMIKFCYTGNLVEDDILILIEILLLANKYDIKGLLEISQSLLVPAIGIDNCLEILDVAHKISSTYLLQKSSRFVLRNFSRIKRTEKCCKLINANPMIMAAILEEV